MIEFDVETAPGLQWYQSSRPFLAQFLGAGTDEQPDLLPVDEGHFPSIQHWLLHDNTGYRAWNTKFDLHMLRAAGFELPHERLWHDGMVAAHLMDERTSVALQARGEKLFGPAARDPEAALKQWLAEEAKRRKAASKETGEQFVNPSYADVPWDIMEPYAAEDVRATRRIGEVYDPLIQANDELRELYELERGVLAALFWMEDRGIPIDRGALVGLEAHLLPLLDSLEDRCRQIARFDNFNPRSPKQVGEALDRLEADTRFMSRDSKTKQLKVDEENLHACDHPLAEAILDYRGTHKVWAMVRAMLHGPSNGEKAKLFPEPYLTGEDRLHPSFKQVGARTGRMSCSDPNFQQIPRDDLRIRYAVKAGPGKVLVCCDLDSIELRLLAAFAGEGAMLDSIRSGRDSHTQTAKMVGLTGRKRSTGAMESARDQGKRFNYLSVYGGGITAIKKWFGVTADEARAMQRRFKDAYPEVASLEQRIEFALEDRGYVKTPWGRRQRAYNRRTAYRESYKFINYLIQGTAADMLKVATDRCHRQGVPLIAAVHDELIAEVDAGDAEEAAQIMQKALTDHERITHKVPITAEAQIVKRWSEAKKPDYRPDYLEE